MGRTAGQEARVAGADRSVADQRVGEARPVLAAVKPKAPTAPRALATPVAPLAAKSASAVPPALSVAPAKASAPPPALPAPAASAAPAAVVAAIPRKGAECKTVREILPPWHVLQEKLQNKTAGIATRDEALNQDAQQALQAQERANAMWSPPSSPPSSARGETSLRAQPASSPDDSIEVPPSGVRMSEPGAAAANIGETSDADLSFKVYTLAELERRSDAPVSMRASRVSFDLTSSRSSKHWDRALAALKTFAQASLEWLKIKGERPKLKVALRQPFDNLGDELQVAVESVDWKKLGVTTGIVVGATLTLLFAVLTAAELTDDLKPPGSAAHLASAETSGIPAKTALDARGVAPATNMAAMGVQPVTPAPIVIAPASATAIGDVDDVSETPAPAAKKKKPAAKKTNKLALRSAPF
jgi:hypothetical protein